MASYQNGESVVIVAQFYDQDANGGEGILTNPTAGKLFVVDTNGNQIAGSPFAMAAINAAQTGVYFKTLVGLAVGIYSYVCIDTAEPTPTICHSHGLIKVENNDFDSLDSEIDTLTTNLATANARLGSDADTYPISSDTKRIHSVAISSPAANSIADYVDALTLAAIENAVWNAATASHTTAGTFGKKVGDITLTTDAAIAAAVWDEVASGHVTDGTFGAIESRKKGPGAGATVVTKDSGGSNNLRPTVSGVAQQGVRIEAYLTSDYVTGLSYDTYGKGSAVTDANGDFALLLGAGAYTLLYYRIRSGATSGLTPTTTTYTVS